VPGCDAGAPSGAMNDDLADYGTNVETERLAQGTGALEFERTKRLVLR
jgi:hypothetical protein